MIQTHWYVEQKVTVWKAVCAAALALPAYSLADFINERSDPPILLPSVVDAYHRAAGHDGFEPYRNKDGTLDYAGIAVAFLASNSKYYGCLPDLGQVDDVLYPPTGSGVRMYVSHSGSDTNDGLTKATAKATLDAVSFGLNSSLTSLQTPATGAVLPAGSRVYIERSATPYPGTIQIKNAASNSDYVIGCYGTPTLPRPTLAFRNCDHGASIVGSGSVVGIAPNSSPTGPFRLQNVNIDGKNASTIFYSGLTGGTPALSDTVTCTRTGYTATISMVPTSVAACIECQGFLIPAGVSGVAGVQAGDTIGNGVWSATVSVVSYPHGFSCNGTTNVTLSNFSTNNCSNNGVSPTGVNNTTAANFLIQQGLVQNSQTVYNKGAGLGGGGGTNVTYDHMTALNNGRDGIFSHGIYVVGMFSPSFVTNCYIYGSSDNGMTLHGGSNGVTVSDNFLEANGNGFGMGPGSFGTDETVTNGVVTRNIVLNTGTLSPFTGAGYGSGIGFACWVNGICSNNQIIGSTGEAAVELSTYGATGFALCTQNTNMQVYNNTIDSAAACAAGIYIKFAGGNPQVSLDIRNNINRSASSAGFAVVRDVGDTIPDSSITLNGNLHYMPNKATSPSSGLCISWKGTSYTLAGFNAFDATKEATQFCADPQFLNPVATASGPTPNGRKFNGIYRQAVAGKLTGAALGVATDFNKTPRTVQNVGAFV